MRLVWIAALALALGCSERDEPPEPEAWTGPPPVGEAEKRRGLAACADYKTRVCACAESRRELAEECRMADGRISALELSLRIAAAESESGDESSSRALAISNARKVMRRCIEQAAELARGCPTPEAARD